MGQEEGLVEGHRQAGGEAMGGVEYEALAAEAVVEGWALGIDVAWEAVNSSLMVRLGVNVHDAGGGGSPAGNSGSRTPDGGRGAMSWAGAAAGMSAMRSAVA